jgi:hypothetical protein
MSLARIMNGTSEVESLLVQYGFSLRMPDGTIQG